MHRTEGPDYVTVSGKRRFKETPTPATVVDKDIMNALQEEVALVIENSGQTLRSTGSLDEIAGWGQLDKAITRRPLVSVLSYGADPTGVSDSTQAFNNAFAAHGHVYVPEGSYKITATITIPDYGMLVGSGVNSRILAYVTSLTVFQVSNSSAFIQDIYISGNTYSSVTPINISLNNAINRVILRNVWINDYQTGIKAISTADDLGMVVLDTVFGSNIDSGGTFLAFPQLTGESCPKLIATNVYESDFASGDNALLFYGTSSVAKRIFANCNFVGGKINVISTSGMVIQNSFLDMDSYSFNGNDSVQFIRNIIGTSKTNTINNNVSNSSRTFWIGNRNANGTRYPLIAVYDGIYVRRNRTTSEQSIAVGTDDVDFNNELERAMTNDASYVKDQPWNGTNHRFEVQGYGERLVYVNCNLIIGDANTSSWAEVNKVDVYIDVVDGAGSGRPIPFSRQILNEHASNGDILFSFNGYIRVFGSGGSWRGFQVKVVNGQADAVVVAIAAVEGFNTYIEAEGL